MGRVLLIVLCAGLLAGCEAATPDPGLRPHADLACAACHQGPQGERGRATVPEASCTGAGCHEQGGPQEVHFATVTFPHRGHGQGGGIDATCAGCHTHDTGDAPLEASVDACALCHINEVSSSDAQECRLCHETPNHSELTSQGVVVSHSELPWVEIGCVRCHYDVSSVEPAVSGLRCRQCHEDMAVLNEAAVGRNLHPIHDGVTCSSCHERDIHQLQAMSSVVDLICSDCHGREHGLPVEPDAWPPRELCSTCHSGIHAPQQRLILGIRPDGGVTPSAKFLAGITCRSCHIPTEPANPGRAIRGQAAACAGCHPAQYTRVLDWWLDGLQLRLTSTTAYVDAASRRVTAPDTARVLLGSARGIVSLVAEAGGQHNLEMSDRLMRQAVELTEQAYRSAGMNPPSPPDLGRVPHTGLCSYCHYETTELWNFQAMPEDFHREILGR